MIKKYSTNQQLAHNSLYLFSLNPAILIAFDDTNTIVSERVMTKKPGLQSSGLSFPVHRKIKKPFEIKTSRQLQEEYPMDKWLMPPQPQRYLKCADHDLL